MPVQSVQKTYSISQAARLLKVTPHVIRRWETEGEISNIQRSEKGHRRYTESNIQELFDIQNRLNSPSLHLQKQQQSTVDKLTKASLFSKLGLNLVLLTLSLLVVFLVSPSLNRQNMLEKITSILGAKSNTNGNVLQASTSLHDYSFNVNIPANFKNTVAINDIDLSSKFTLENTLDISGEVIGNGMSNTVIADGVIDGDNLIAGFDYTDDAEFSGSFNISGTFDIDGTTVESTADELNLLSGLGTSSEELGYLEGATVTANGILFGDGSKFTQDTSGFAWNPSTNALTLNAVSYIFPASQGSSATYLQNDGSGNLSWQGLSSGASAWELSGTNLYLTSTSYNVGVGTSSPSDKLAIAGGTLIGSNYAGIGITAPSNGLIVEGNVGIGTTNPSGLFEVGGTGNVSFSQSGYVDFSYGGVRRLYTNVLTVNANGGADYSDISSALSAATSGDAVYVYPGTYTGNLTIPSGVSLIGADRSSTIIQAPSHSRGPTVTLGGSNHLGNISIYSDTNGWTYTALAFSTSAGGATIDSINIFMGYINDNATHYGIDTSNWTTGNFILRNSNILLNGNGNSSATYYGFYADTKSTAGYIQVTNNNIQTTVTNGSAIAIRATQPGYAWTLYSGLIGNHITAYSLNNSSTSYAFSAPFSFNRGFNNTISGKTLNMGTRYEEYIIRGNANLSDNTVLYPSASTYSPLILRGATSQTASLLEWQDSSSNKLGAISSGGNIGIGTTSPGDKLAIAGGTLIGSSYAGIGITAPSNGLLVQGNVGIGTTNPAQKFDVLGNVRVNNTLPYIDFSNGATNLGYVGIGNNNSFFSDGLTGALNIRATNALQLGSGSTSDMTIATNGNVGIGTSNPGYKVHIATTGNANNFVVNDSNGRIGFNTTSLNGAININGTDGTDSTRSVYFAGGDGKILNLGTINSSGYGTVNLYTTNLRLNGFGGSGILSVKPNASTQYGIQIRGATSQSAALIRLEDENGDGILNITGSAGAPTLTIHDTNDGGFSDFTFDHSLTSSSGSVGTGTGIALQAEVANGTQPTIANIRTYTTDNTSNSVDADLYFSTIANNSLTEKLRITNVGYVGIGTTSPNTRLEVFTSTSLDGFLTTDGTRWMRFMPGTVSTSSYNPMVLANDNTLIFSNGTINQGSLVLAPWASSAGGLRINSSGNIGIGTTAAGEKLTVSGGALIGSSYAGVGITAPTNGLLVQGNVGIGTTNPAQKFDVLGNVRVNNTLPYIDFSNGATNLGYVGIGNNNSFFSDGLTGALNIRATNALQLGSGSTSDMTIATNGNVGIGTTTPGSKLSISGLGSSTGTNLVIDGNGDVFADSSSARYKENIQNTSLDSSLLYQLQPVSFNYKETGTPGIGYLAEDLDSMGLTDVVVYDKDGLPDAIKYDRLTLYLVEALKEQKTILDSLDVNNVYDIYQDIQDFVSALGLSVENNSLLVSTDMNVLGNSTLADLTITGDLNIGLLQFDSLNNSISMTSSDTLYLQNHPLAGKIDIFNGKISIEPDGTLAVKELRTDVLSITSSQSADSEFILAGNTSVDISSDIVNSDSLILLTAKTNTQEASLYVQSQESGGFTVGLTKTLPNDIEFNWLVVNR